MQIHVTNFLSKELYNAWERLEKNDNITPFLYIDFMHYVALQTLYISRYSPKYYYIEDNGRIIFIAPLKKHKIKNTIDTLGNLQMCDFTDFLIDKSLSQEKKKDCLILLKNYIRRPFYLSRIPSNSKILSIYSDMGVLHKIYSHQAVCISFGDEFNSYFNKLSKSVRQNIRTAYNRLQRNSKDYRIEFIYGSRSISKDLKKDTKSLYNKRQMACYIDSKWPYWKKIFKILLIKYFRHDNFSLYKNKNKVVVALYIDGQIAACILGLHDKNYDRIVIPRLAIDSEFSFYSPGYILLCETIKYCIDNTSFKHLDLCRGTEKYKMDLGGAIYSSEFVEIK